MTAIAEKSRYAGDSMSTARHYRVPKEVLRDIQAQCPVYGSQARVLQVATEILIRQTKPIKLRYTVKTKDGAEIWHSLKLLPRTIELIDKLTEVYGSHGKVFFVCVKVLKMKMKMTAT